VGHTKMAQTGFTPISLYYTATASAVPTAGNLVAGELAINTNDGKLFYKDSSGVVQTLATKGGVGSSTTTQVLYNSSGLVVGSANMTFNGATLTAAGFSGPINGTVGATTANTGAFTTLSASSTVSGTGFTNYFASPPALGGTAAAAVSSTNLAYTGTLTGGTGIVNLGSGQFYKDASGNVGIGTANASAFAAGATKTFVNYDATSVSNVLGVNSAVAGYMLSNATTTVMGEARALPLLFLTNNLERMRIDSSGNVGIGTSSPSVKLQVNGPIAVQGTAAYPSSGSGIELVSNTTSTTNTIISYNRSTSSWMDLIYQANTHIWATSGSEQMRIDASGNVGIGTSTPAVKLDVAGPIKTLGYTVATLPTGVTGMKTYVTDALAPTFGATVVGGGAVTIPVFYNGTNWIVG